MHPQAPVSGNGPIQFLLHTDLRTEARDAAREIGGDEYVLGVPLRTSDCEIQSQGKTIFSGNIVPGMLRIGSPNERWRKMLKGPWESIWLSIPAPQFSDFIGDPDPRKDSRGARSSDLLVRPVRDIATVSRALIPGLSLDVVHRDLFLDGITRCLLALMFHEQALDRLSAKSTARLSLKEMQLCSEFADAHMETTLQVGTWAASIGMSAGEFSRRFVATTGLSPYRWFLNRRLDRAKHLLLSSDASLSQMAISLGFATQSHFTEAFRKYSGLSPARWKRFRKA